MLPSLAAALTTGLLPAFAMIAPKETLRIQIGKEKDVLDTITLVIEYDKRPEVPHPNGASWAELEKDSLWEDGEGRHLRYSRAFRAALGSRKGYGFDYIHYSARGSDVSAYSAGVSFVFPGDTVFQVGWEPIHMHRYGGIYPYEATGFVSGCELYGQVSRFVGVESGNLAQGQWALLLSRKKERPVLEQEPKVYGKETLHIQVGKGNAILDTVRVRIEYEKPPEVPRPDGASWSSEEKDSAWVDEEGWHVRYTHAFLASMGSKQGFGNDKMHVSVLSEQFNDEPQYSAGVGITIPGDTTLSFYWDPNHIAEKPEAYPFHTSGFRAGMEQYGQVLQHVGGRGENLAQDQWAKLLLREKGWREDGDGGTTAARPVRRMGRVSGWLVHLAPGTALQAPPGATGLKILDVQGRVHWERAELREGEQVVLPGGLNTGVFRYYWHSDRG